MDIFSQKTRARCRLLNSTLRYSFRLVRRAWRAWRGSKPREILGARRASSQPQEFTRPVFSRRFRSRHARWTCHTFHEEIAPQKNPSQFKIKVWGKTIVLHPRFKPSSFRPLKNVPKSCSKRLLKIAKVAYEIFIVTCWNRRAASCYLHRIL